MNILFEDNYLLIVNKPSGLMVEEDRFGNPSLFANAYAYLQKTSKKEVFLANVHRLDRPASGILVFAKKKSALKIMSEQFHLRTVTKTYLAISNRLPEARKGKLVNYLFKDVHEKKAKIVSEDFKGSQRVELNYKIIESKNNYHLWEINLFTGKYHQIRVQMANLGCVIIGDDKYGSAIEFGENSICLHAWKFKFIHPISQEEILIEAPLPDKNPYSLFK